MSPDAEESSRPPGEEPRARPCLTVHDGDDIGREYFLEPGVAKVGRGKGCQVRLADRAVSTLHAEIEVPAEVGAPCFVRDVKSRNGTYINGKLVERGPLGDQDRFHVGDTVLSFAWKVPSPDRYTRKLFRAATRDVLVTDIWNRRELSRRIEEAWILRQEEDEPMSLILVDIDHFKRVNDTHALAAGDAVLLSTVSVMRRIVDGRDCIGRFGGDEFVLLLADTPQAEAEAIAERLRAAVETNAIPAGVPGGSLQVTLSIGVASAPPLAAEGPRDLFDAANRALLQAKRGGKNRCVVASERRRVPRGVREPATETAETAERPAGRPSHRVEEPTRPFDVEPLEPPSGQG